MVITYLFNIVKHNEVHNFRVKKKIPKLGGQHMCTVYACKNIIKALWKKINSKLGRTQASFKEGRV